MIQEDYVSYETAKMLKEKGFNVPVPYSFRITGSGPFWAATIDWNNDEETEQEVE